MNTDPPQLPPVSKRKIKRITPLQLGKMLAMIYGGMSLLIVPVFLMFGTLAGMMSKAHGGTALPAIFSVGFAIFLPFAYAAMGFVLGVIGAFVYNLVAQWIGGIEVEVE